MKTIIFCDTNKLYGALRFFLRHQSFGNSSLQQLCQQYTVVISTTVLAELLDIYQRYHTIKISERQMTLFIDNLGCKVSKSRDVVGSSIMKYVSDIDDAQILQDAIDIQATILLTNNLKDFAVQDIADDFNMIVTAYVESNYLS